MSRGGKKRRLKDLKTQQIPGGRDLENEESEGESSHQQGDITIDEQLLNKIT